MQVVVTGRNMEVSDRLRDWAEGKISKLGRVLPGLAEAEVEFSNPKTRSADSRYVAQVTLKVNGALIRGEQSAADTYSAMDAVLEKLERQVSRHRTRKQAGKARAAVALKEMPLHGVEEVDEEIEPAEEGEGRLVRVKRFQVKPMDVEEALDQMQLLGHDFFVFINSETEGVSVVYRRHDGNFGLIEPELT